MQLLNFCFKDCGRSINLWITLFGFQVVFPHYLRVFFLFASGGEFVICYQSINQSVLLQHISKYDVYCIIWDNSVPYDAQ